MILTNFRFAVRLLAKQPMFAAVAILAMALGIGAVTSAFGLLNALLLRPLPRVTHQDRLVAVMQTSRREPGSHLSLCYPDYRTLQRESRTLEGVFCVQDRTFILTDGQAPERLLGCSISAGAFALLGVRPVLGRDFRPEEEKADAPLVVLLGYSVWQRRYAGDSNILARPIMISGTPATVVGVLPPGWRYPEQSDIWMPLREDREVSQRGSYYLTGVGKLKAGVTLAAARADADLIAHRLSQAFPKTNAEAAFRLEPLRDWLTRDTHLMLGLMLGAVVFVHLIACANVANLLLARGARRRREVALRVALGATRGQILVQLFVENLVLAGLGGAVGVLLSVWASDFLAFSMPRELPFWMEMGLDGRVLSCAIGTALISALLFGAAPAWQLTKPHLIDQLKEGGRGSSDGRHQARVRQCLVVGEIALAMVLLVGAGLMLRSLWMTHALDPGFDARNVLTFRVGLPPAHYTNRADYIGFFDRVVHRLAALPGVTAAGAFSSLPADRMEDIQSVEVEGRPSPRLHEAPRTRLCIITPGALPALRIPLVRGRDFLDTDATNTLRVALVDERFAKIHFAGQEPLGRRFRPLAPTEKNTNDWLTVVGVVRDVRTRFDGSVSYPAYYVPHRQDPEAFMSCVVRVAGEPSRYQAMAQGEVFAVNRSIPIYHALTMTQVVDRANWDKRFFGTIFTFLALLALFLAALGIYGVMAYTVSQRTQEIGVRMALGARPRDVIGMVIRHGARQLMLGLAIGLGAALLLAKSLQSTLYGIHPHDPAIFVMVPILLGVVALLACYLPARRAARVSPVVALRYE